MNEAYLDISRKDPILAEYVYSSNNLYEEKKLFDKAMAEHREASGSLFMPRHAAICMGQLNK